MAKGALIEVPLSELEVSPTNLRKTGSSDVADLVASIRAHGLLQNLTVVKKDGGWHEVVAGGRRLRALKQLAAESALPPDWPVPCRVISADEAIEAGLTENVSRQAMHPADEFDAFAKLAASGSTVGDIAAHFGCTARFVQQRMKLANVAPSIVAQYRAGEATLEQLMALAITDDQKLQLRVWKMARHNWDRDADRLRETITEGEFSIDSQLGKFVGIEAYEKAGGQVRRDLFGEESDSYLTDVALVQRLAQEKLERTAEKVRKEGWAWIEARVKFDWEEKAGFCDAPVAWKGNKRTYADDVRQHAGAIVHVGYNGQTEVERGLIKPEDRKAAKVSAKGAKSANGADVKAAGPRKPDDVSFASIQRLQAEAGQAIALHVLDRPDVALALLAAELASHVFYTGWDNQRTWVRVARQPTSRMPGALKSAIEKTRAGEELRKAREDWVKKLPKKREGLRAWVLDQDSATVRNLLAFLVANEIDVVDMAPRQQDGVTALAASIHVDLASEWKPSAEWLATVPKRVVLAMLKDAGVGAVELGKLQKQPKAKFVAAALPLFPVAWLPKPLRPSAIRKPKAKRVKPIKPTVPAPLPAPKATAGAAEPYFPWSTAE